MTTSIHDPIFSPDACTVDCGNDIYVVNDRHPFALGHRLARLKGEMRAKGYHLSAMASDGGCLTVNFEKER